MRGVCRLTRFLETGGGSWKGAPGLAPSLGFFGGDFQDRRSQPGSFCEVRTPLFPLAFPGWTMSVMNTRTETQADAARLNGARSSGPITVAGKQSASMNAVKGGFGARGLLLPHESADEYAALVSSWTETLRPSSTAEANLVARVADLNWRLERLARMEHAAILAEAERLVREGAYSKALTAHRNLREMFSGLATLASETKLSRMPQGSVDEILKTIRQLVENVVRLGIEGAEVTLLQGKIRELALGELIGEEDEVWRTTAEIARRIEARLAASVAALEDVVEGDRKKIMETAALGDEGQLRRLRRHRLSLQRELDGVLGTVQKVRELAATSLKQLPDRSVVAVELRMISITAASR